MYIDFPLGTGTFTTKDAIDENGAAVPTGTGIVTMYKGETATPLTGVSWPLAHTWNAATGRYESPIADSAVLLRSEGDVIRTEVKITAPNGDIYRRVVRSRVRG
jgi:hypothetical protein